MYARRFKGTVVGVLGIDGTAKVHSYSAEEKKRQRINKTFISVDV